MHAVHIAIVSNADASSLESLCEGGTTRVNERGVQDEERGMVGEENRVGRWTED